MLITQMKGKAGTLRQSMCFLLFSSVIMSMGVFVVVVFILFYFLLLLLLFVFRCLLLLLFIFDCRDFSTRENVFSDFEWLIVLWDCALLSSNHCTLFYTVHLKKCECVVVVACFDFVQTQPTKGIKSDFFNCLVNILWNCDVFVSRS